MKTARLFTCLIVAMLIFTAWTPSIAYAAPAGMGASSPSLSAVDATTAKLVKLTVYNKTGGPLIVTLRGAQTYFFYAANQGKTTFMIMPGKYQYTITGCGGGTLTKTRNFQGGGNLGPYICRKA